MGQFPDHTGKVHGFLDTAGLFSTIDVPGAFTITSAHGINNAGQIVGEFNTGTTTLGFLDTAGTFTTIGVPGTLAHGINAAGQIVGESGSPTHGFLDIAGTFTTIDVPGAVLTRAFGINDAGQIVGEEETTGPTGGTHGFLATPVPNPVPEPSTWLLLGSGLVGLVLWRRMKSYSQREAER